MGAKPRMVFISPVRNEEDYLELTIKAMVSQTVQPVEWIIVDDGSTDSTRDIVNKYIPENKWIRLVEKPDRGARSVGPGVVEAFYFGYDQIQTKDYDFVCKMDGDIDFKDRYFERLLEYFEKDPRLGAASGKPYLEVGDRLVPERKSDEMVAGMINFYRRECFEDVGGFVREVHWDGIVFHMARIKGWRTGSFDHPDMRFIHKRVMGSSHQGIWTGRLRWGRGQWFMGTHPLYLLAITTYRLMERPFFLGGLGIFCGYVQAAFQGMKRYEYPGFRKSLHAWQFERLKLGKRLEKIPVPE